MNQPDKNDNDRLWKMVTLFDQQNDIYAKFYSPSEHLSVDKVIVLFKESFSNSIFQRNKRTLV
jgi:hypothetical protein